MRELPFEIAEGKEETSETLEIMAEKALLARAQGFTYREIKIETQGGKEKRVETIKYQPPDMAAIKFYLQNRCPERWKEGGGNEDVPIELVVIRSDKDG